MSGSDDSSEEFLDDGRPGGLTSASPARPRARRSYFDDSSQDVFDDGRAGGLMSAAPAHSRAPVFGFDDSSEEVFRGGRAGAGPDTERVSRRTRHRRRNALLERQIEESRCFQPDEVDPGRCQALRSARVQCHSAKVVSTDYCRVHQRKRYNGVVRGALPAPVLAKFRDAEARTERKNKPKKLYSRYHM